MAAAVGMPRQLEPELLDELSPADPRARRSRGDLRRIHRLLGTLGFLERTLPRGLEPRRILEIGAGDGSLMLRLARLRARDWPGVELTLLDRHDLVDSDTRKAFADLGWSLQVQAADVFDGLRAPAPAPWDLVCANLFLHHFGESALRTLFAGIAARTRLFCACEPLRAALPLAGSRCLGLLGAGAVTRNDAVASVRAGFRDGELRALWPADAGWQLQEKRFGLFSLGFVARRHD